MVVYVDDANIAYGRMCMCHMIADSRDELIAMVNRIGVSEKWLQHAGEKKEHFDISRSKRSAAVVAGAIEITQRELVEIIGKRHDSSDGRFVLAT